MGVRGVGCGGWGNCGLPVGGGLAVGGMWWIYCGVCGGWAEGGRGLCWQPPWAGRTRLPGDPGAGDAGTSLKDLLTFLKVLTRPGTRT